MKDFDLQSRAIIMCGISGSGKTHYARSLEKKGYLRLSTDLLIWEKTGTELYKLSKEEKNQLFSMCRALVRDEFIALLKSGHKVVIDATHCKRSSRDEMRHICSEIGVKPVFVYCDAEEEELWRRLSQRKGNGPDDLIVTREDLSEYWLGFERPQADETDFIFLKQV